MKTSSLHDAMVTYEAVSPGEFARGDVQISYGIHTSPFGKFLIGLTKRGICYAAFADMGDEAKSIAEMKSRFPQAQFLPDQKETASVVRRIFSPAHTGNNSRPLHLLIRGTNFQIKVWEALLSIPPGRTLSYKEVASRAGSPAAVRAVGSACGGNLIAFLIPCHRVLTSDAGIGGYRWGRGRKKSMLEWEALRGHP